MPPPVNRVSLAPLTLLSPNLGSALQVPKAVTVKPDGRVALLRPLTLHEFWGKCRCFPGCDVVGRRGPIVVIGEREVRTLTEEDVAAGVMTEEIPVHVRAVFRSWQAAERVAAYLQSPIVVKPCRRC